MVAGVALGRPLREMRAAALWLCVLVVAAGWRGAEGLALLLPVSVLVANLPQLVVAWRESDLTGLSVGTWLLSIAEAAVWAPTGRSPATARS